MIEQLDTHQECVGNNNKVVEAPVIYYFIPLQSYFWSLPRIRMFK